MTNQKLYIFLISCLLGWSNSLAQIVPKLYRLNDIGGPSFDIADEIAIDSDDNLYMLGDFGATVDFDHGPGIASLTANGFLDLFIAKYNKHGDFQWVNQVTYTGVLNPKSLDMDSSGALVVMGTFSGTVDFDPAGAGLTTTAIGGNSDVFVLKLDLDGDIIWLKTFGSNSSDQAADATVDHNGNVYVTGAFSDTIDFNPTGTPMVLIPDALYHNYILKLDELGNTEWVRTNVGTGTNSYGWSLSCDASNHVYFAGEFQDSISFGPGFNTLIGNSIKSTFVEKFDSNGTTVWVKNIAGTTFTEPSGILYNPLDQFLYITGMFQQTADFDPGVGVVSHTSNGNNNDAYITKWDTSGNLVWVNVFGNEGHDQVNKISYTNTNELLVFGSFQDTLDLDAGAAVFDVISNGGSDMYLMKLDPNGSFIGAFSQGGAGNETIRDFIVDSDDAYYCFGYYEDTVDFDPSADSLVLVSNGTYNIFLQKFYSCSFIDSVVNNANLLSVQTGANSYQWIDCRDSLPIPSEPNATFSPTVSGSYACIIDFGGCFDTTFCTIIAISTTGLNQFSENAFKIFPVPFGESLTIEAENWESTLFSLLDAMGRKVTGWVKMTSSSYLWQLPNLEKGIYFVEIRDGSKELKRIKVMN